MPLCCDNDEALALLGGVAGLFLLHDRPILNRIDDSVVRRDDGRTTTLRRARGLAPGALELPPGFASMPPMLADYRRYHRRGTFEPVVLLGGERAMTEPWRNTLAHLLHGFDWPALVAEFGDLPLMADLQTRPVELLAQMARDNLNSPLCSSAGRLFDAVAAALGICRDRISYEGQAALELEALAGRAAETGAYPVEVLRRDGLWRLGFRPLWQALLTDLAQGAPSSTIAARFHNGLGRGVADLAGRICEEGGVGRVVLAGGVFQNALLKSAVSRHLHQRGIQVLTPEAFPAGDGAISLGQVAVAAAREGD